MENGNPDDNLKIEKPGDDNDGLLQKIGESIVKQMDSDIETMTMVEEAEMPPLHVEMPQEEKPQNKFLVLMHKLRDKMKSIPIWLRAVALTVGVLILLCVILFATPLWRVIFGRLGAEYVSEQVNYVPVTGVVHQDPVDDVEDTAPPEVTEAPVMTITPAPTMEPVDDPDIKNILLLGEEAMDSGGHRGRTDLMIIATLNRREGTMSLTTLMRDMLVSIPGYEDNKLNVAYQIGGVDLLYQVLEYNLNIKVNNYALVNFESFETIIDTLNGVEMTLTAQEAEYLNTTNYISNPEYRNLVSGLNVLNGNQALGYCRIRGVASAEGEYNDFGRTSRQRKMLASLFDKVGKLGYLDVFSLASKCLPMVTTDITSAQMEEYLNIAYDIGMSTELSTYRIPISGSFTEGYVRKMSVIIPDMDINRGALMSIMYGDSAYGSNEEETE